MEEQVNDPNAPPAPQEGEQQESTGQPQEEKLLAGKFKTPEELEKAYSESVRKMHEATTQAAEMRRQMETPPVQDQAPQQQEASYFNLTPEQREEYESKTGFSPEQLFTMQTMMRNIVTQTVNPLENTIYEDRVKDRVTNFFQEGNRQQFQNFRNEVETKLSSLPPTERVKSANIQRAFNDVVVSHIDELMQAKTNVPTGQPQEPPQVNSTSSPTFTPRKPHILSKEVREDLERRGLNADDVEKIYRGETQVNENVKDFVEL
jgi:hypothetical protein